MPSIREFLERTPIEASAPCRIDMGGTLDLSTFYLPLHHLAPCTFNAALNMRTRVRLLPHRDGRIKVSSRGFEPVDVEGRSAPFTSPVGLMLAVASYFNIDGVHIHIDSTSPPRSALGGSSVAATALVWAISKVLTHQGRAMPSPDSVAALAHAIEQSIAGVPCGLQDHLAAVYGGVHGRSNTSHVDDPGYVRKAIITADGYPEFEQRLLVAYCGVPHVSKDINGTWVREFLAGRHRDKWERIIEHSRAFIASLATADDQGAVAAMNAETDLRVEMTPEVLDAMGSRLVAAARRQQCGARFTGAGGGGCIWAMGAPANIASLRSDWQAILATRPEAALLDVHVDPNGIL